VPDGNQELKSLLDLLPDENDYLIEENGTEDEYLLVDPLGFSGQNGIRVSEAGRWHLYAFGYKHAADLLVKRSPKRPEDDELLYPIIALYRHFVEMRLKSCIAACSSLGEEPIPLALLDNHSLSKLWEQMKTNLKHLGPEVLGLTLVGVEKLILEVGNLDSNAQSARYPFDKKGPTLTEQYSINIVHFKNIIEKLEAFFDVIEGAVDFETDQREEWQSILRSV
jgi:hypothetical protein